jgi:predicted nucleic acid-binding Zn finger protein
MDFFDREYLISQILSGEIIWGKYTLYPPNLSIQHKINYIFKKSYDDALGKGLLLQDDLTDFCLKRGFVTDEDLVFLEFCQKEVENFQKELYISRKREEDVKKIRKYIELNRTRQTKILNIIQKNNSYTVEGYANYCKISALVREITYKGKKKCSFKKVNIDRAISHYINNTILPSTIRSLSRSQPWMNMWSAYKVNGVVFPQGCQMTTQQQLLLMWSRMYDSIQEASEPPESFVIEDDDMLDGWLLLQSSKNEGEKINSKISRAQEQYIIANNINEAREIENKNSPDIKRIKAQRQKALEENGELNESELPDVKRKLMIEANRLSLERKNR